MKGSKSGANLWIMMRWIASSNIRMPMTSTSPLSDSSLISRNWALPDLLERCRAARTPIDGGVYSREIVRFRLGLVLGFGKCLEP